MEKEIGDVLENRSKWAVAQGDCLEFLRQMPPDSASLVFGSPPYSEARTYLEGGKNLGIARKTDAWVSWMADVFQAAQAACTGLVAMVVAGQTKNFKWSAGPALLMAELHRAGMNLRNPPIFHRVGIPGSGGPDWLRADTEFIVCTSRSGKLPWSDNTSCGEKPKYRAGGEMSYRTLDGERINKKPDMNLTTSGTHNGDTTYRKKRSPIPDIANPGNVVKCNVGGGNMGSAIAHESEAPFPEPLPEFFIRSFSQPGGLVIDPFVGSGTTGAVAIRNGRRFIGIDLRQSQVDLSRRRIALVTPDMFEVAKGNDHA